MGAALVPRDCPRAALSPAGPPVQQALCRHLRCWHAVRLVPLQLSMLARISLPSQHGPPLQGLHPTASTTSPSAEHAAQMAAGCVLVPSEVVQQMQSHPVQSLCSNWQGPSPGAAVQHACSQSIIHATTSRQLSMLPMAWAACVLADCSPCSHAPHSLPLFCAWQAPFCRGAVWHAYIEYEQCVPRSS